MKKLQILQKMMDYGVVAVLRGESADQVFAMAEQAIAGGIKVIEVTLTVPGALHAIEKLSRMYSWKSDKSDNFAIIGAGTVLEPQTARAAMMAGAEFVVSPSLNPETVKICNLYRVPVLPGVTTLEGVQHALELGVDIVKLFPGNLYQPSIIKTLKGPMPQANFMPTGGVSLDNLGEWIKGGAVAVGIGSDLTTDAIKTGDLSLVRQKSEQYMKAYHEAKQG
ncbi:bifunctional 2-keto-4-hydroxyglutarate aldolase/2-keto-3-deoxy-6-phosphogluconate aldolase [Paenibacillus hunanensis]|uniref:2-dehydro-3-deoxyphosphogluconate aldolase/(4S)-4-hydroxy-2-oxoglutarate aldolase n=1 Tax=Paenibacillus hunanensis TaxID=539262 RepID=A0ABU1J154_9BACL|nr:bifunctional 2-keto-4-hydroxyglutarate aldolase/2-keto-3-deoxy-6-phosphogluconate aldolase [Paenibacillus hunanensis]MCL9661990.1 bifunctional 2-keto-4-hydroxyglutarate aldolase/2-keto-3-deoxy-6-phosphogluconate aldolase [Paenibacillus hunanensis]MDR6244347.1 2-dehydro-3-deoxyphosphogluconate aldolase/(4S)-4-hydroxy-2-oxoglutarate aldolase [Paenibacillus hunanensis]WPP42569.1 bifunctional 2-keto-4-hydroxyglutarate aldolase/2-keto-3-deoxy-6-phosphogluconate aldolase [Paenibacillus hunanensis]